MTSHQANQVASYITPSTKRLAIQRGELSSQHRAVHHVIMRVEVCALSQAPAALTHTPCWLTGLSWRGREDFGRCLLAGVFLMTHSSPALAILRFTEMSRCFFFFFLNVSLLSHLLQFPYFTLPPHTHTYFLSLASLHSIRTHIRSTYWY